MLEIYLRTSRSNNSPAERSKMNRSWPISPIAANSLGTLGVSPSMSATSGGGGHTKARTGSGGSCGPGRIDS